MTDDRVEAAADLGDGVAMPMVGFGTWQLRGKSAYESTRYALAAGYRHLDTATMYRNETEVGRAIRDSGLDRREVFITTKLPPGNAGRERATIEASLRDLPGSGLYHPVRPNPRHRGRAAGPGWVGYRDVV